MCERYTPGPWQVYADLPSAEPNWHIVTNASRMRVIANVHIEPGNSVDRANARLIAAAPDLHAALCRMLEMFGPGNQDTHAVRSAHAAITKAEGQETGDVE